MPLLDPEWDNVVRIVGGSVPTLDAGLAEVRRCASNPSHLTEFERLLVWVYSSTNARWYETINGQLWTTPGPDVRIFARLLDRCLAKLDVYSGEVFRGYRTDDLDNFLLRYYPTKIVRWPGFTSTSIKVDKAFGGNILFRIMSQGGRILGVYADDVTEEEVLFPTETQFRVVWMEREIGSAVVWLDEVI